jgi:L-alanine-DL-glutamate epimerase-like enolase superfamily enzyme
VGRVRVSDVRVVIHERPAPKAAFGPSGPSRPLGVLRILTDEGLEGNAFLSPPGPGPYGIAEQVTRVIKPWLVGSDPLDIGSHGRRMEGLRHYLSPHAAGVTDIALWDLAGKTAGLAVHRMLGTVRDRVRAYLSSSHHAAASDYSAEAAYWLDQGWQGYKLHPPRGPWLPAGSSPPVTFDIEACQAVRATVGGAMELMLDSSWAYLYPDALRVGKAIEELGFYWYEDPLPDRDIHGYQRLKQHLSVPILATEITPGGLEALAPWITSGATDFLRGDVVIKGGITGLVKIAHAAEAFGMNCEIHDSYNALDNVAALHVAMAVHNCEWLEILTFNEAGSPSLEGWNYGLATPISVDSSGYIHAPAGPGLGVEIDWDLINSNVAAVIS